MRKRRKKRRGRDEDKVVLQSRSRRQERDGGEKVAGEEKRPFSPQHLANMQRQYGNAYVQRLLAEEQTSILDEMDDVTEYTFQPTVKLRPGGVLEIDLKPGLELRNFNITNPEWQQRIKQWVGLGGVEFGTTTAPTTDIKVQRDGKLELQLGSALPAELRTMAEAAGQPLELERPFGDGGLTAEATLHVEQKPLEDVRLDRIQQFLNRHRHQENLYLHINLQAAFPPGQDVQDMELLEGNVLLVAEE